MLLTGTVWQITQKCQTVRTVQKLTTLTKHLNFNLIDGSRNYVFGINVVNMHNNQYGEATLFKYLVHPSLHTVYRFSPDGQVYQLQPGSNEFNMFMAAWKEVYGTDFSFPAL